MSACEVCWAAAQHRALMGQGHVAELYAEQLAAHAEGHDQ